MKRMSEDTINRMVEPLVEGQEAINNYTLKHMARQMKKIIDKDLDALDLMSFVYLAYFINEKTKMGNTMSKKQKQEFERIRATLKDIAKQSYASTKPLYDYRNIPFVSLNKNTPVITKTNDIIDKAMKNLQRKFQTQAFMLRDPANRTRLIPTSISDTYNQVINRAAQTNQQGAVNYSKTIQDTIDELANSGLRSVAYEAESGKIHTQSLEAAVRRNVLDAVRDINQTIQDEVGKQTGADGKEITVHRNPAPDHAPIQGHQFTNEEYDLLQNEQDFEDVNGNKFTAIRRPIGVWNCRHFTYSIIVGVTKPNFTPEELDRMNAENEAGYTLPNGKHLTMYECTQEQRRMEREVRKLREKLELAKICDLDTVPTLEARLHDKLSEYINFSRDCGLKPRLDKTLLHA